MSQTGQTSIQGLPPHTLEKRMWLVLRRLAWYKRDHAAWTLSFRLMHMILFILKVSELGFKSGNIFVIWPTLLQIICYSNKKVFKSNDNYPLADSSGYIVHKFEHAWGRSLHGEVKVQQVWTYPGVSMHGEGMKPGPCLRPRLPSVNRQTDMTENKIVLVEPRSMVIIT